MVRFMLRGWVTELYILPQFHFTYAGFGWVRPLPPAGMWCGRWTAVWADATLNKLSRLQLGLVYFLQVWPRSMPTGSWLPNRSPSGCTLAHTAVIIFHGLTGLLLLFFLSQILLPLRHWLYPGNVNWNEEGFRFAWRVMLVEKTGQVTFFVRNVASGAEWLVLPGDYLTEQQEKQMAFQPDMIVQFAHFLAEQYPQPVAVRAEAYVSWNGRPSRLLLDPTINLVNIAANWHHKFYVLSD